MSSIVNKVKEALHSAHDTTSDQRAGKLDISAEERARLESAGYGSGHKADKRHVGATEDIATAPGGHHPSHYLNQQQTSALPGAFPGSEQETLSTHHKDGREYVAPSGTHVGQSDRSRQEVSDRNLMDPADRGTGSNVMEAPSIPGANTRSNDATFGTSSVTQGQSGHNKLHKRDDPRGHVAFTEPPTNEYGTTGASTTSGIQTQGATGYNTASGIGTTGTSAIGTHSTHGGQHTSDVRGPTATTGISDTTGISNTTRTSEPYGSSELPRKPGDTGDIYDQQASRGYADTAGSTNYSYPTHTGPGMAAAATGGVIGGATASHISERGQHEDRSGYTIGSGQQYGDTSVASTTGDGHTRGHGVYNTVIGAGSNDDPTHGHQISGQTFASHPGVSTGNNATPREAGDSHISSGYGSNAATVAGAGAGAAGAGVAGLASHQDQKSHEPGTTGRAPTGYQTDRGTSTTGYGTQTSSTAPLPATLTSTGAATGTSGSDQNTTYGTTGSGANTYGSGVGNVPGTTTTHTTGTSKQPTTNSPGSSITPEHYGPGHTGSKVMHTCTKCGEDNDITHYFKKDIVYRISQ